MCSASCAPPPLDVASSMLEELSDQRADLQDIAGVDQVLAEIDARAKELERRTAAVLAAQNTYEPDRRSP